MSFLDCPVCGVALRTNAPTPGQAKKRVNGHLHNVHGTDLDGEYRLRSVLTELAAAHPHEVAG